jgi:hypothetical protein
MKHPTGSTALILILLWSLASPGQSSISVRAQDISRAATPLAHTTRVDISAGPNGALIVWTTSFVPDNLGFNIYREQGGMRTQVNPSLIAGSALTGGLGSLLDAGRAYQWFDVAGVPGSRYYIEAVSLNGQTNLTGPFTPVWQQNLPKIQLAKLVSEVVPATNLSAQVEAPAGTFDRPLPIPAAVQDQWAIAAQPGLKIGIRQDGWYRVTQPEMAAAGFDVSGDAKNLRLFVDGREVAMEVSRVSGPLTAGDYLEFYGTGLDTPTTDTHVYYLINGSQPGLRIAVFGDVHTEGNPFPAVAPNASPSPETVSSSPMNGSFSLNRFGPVWSGAGIKEAGKSSPPKAVSEESTAPPSVDGSKASDSLSSKTVPVPFSNGLKKTTSVTGPDGFPKSKATASSPETPRSRKSRGRRKSHSHRHGRARMIKRRSNHALASTASAVSFLSEVQLKERFVYFTSLLNGTAENFFGGSLTLPPLASTTKTLNLTNVQTDSQGTAFLRVALQGTTLQAHLVNVFLNDTMVGSVSFNFQEYPEQTFGVPVSQLREGANVVKVVIAGDSGDHSLFSYVRITYPRRYRADNDSLRFTLRSTQDATVDGFTTPNLRVLDISDPNSVQEVHTVVANSGSGYAISVPPTGTRSKAARTLLAQPAASFLQAASISVNQASTLNQSNNAADFLIISHQSFLSLTSLAAFVSQRRSQGFTVKVVDVEDVFDEFSYGLHTPQAITDFLARARSAWTKAPSYLLLLGDASYDPRNYTGNGNFDFVPTKLIDTGAPGTSTALETASDDALADFDGDGIPEMAIGRLPVRTADEANLVLSKIVNFSPSNVSSNAVMVADRQCDAQGNNCYYWSFEDSTDDLIKLLPANMQSSVQKVYRRLEPSDTAARTDIINKINQGAALVNYSGHGNVDVWTGAPIFSNSDALALTNGNKLPLVIVMDCLNGYFVAPNLDCIGESLLKAPNGGSVASFVSSGLTIPDGQHAMGQKLFELLYGGQPIALGDATRQAKSATTDLDVRRTWILLGDPSMKIR